MAGLSNVQAVLGPNSGVTDKEIKDSLWYYYFDEEKVVGWLLGKRLRLHKEPRPVKRMGVSLILGLWFQFLPSSLS